jgi:hypothetical protein
MLERGGTPGGQVASSNALWGTWLGSSAEESFVLNKFTTSRLMPG